MAKQGLYPQVTLDPDWVTREVYRLLTEDLAGGDITTNALVDMDVMATAQIEAAERLVFVGAIIIPAVLEGHCESELRVLDGQQVNAGEIIATVAGPARHILNRERILLNLLQHLSGIATLTRACVEKATPFGVNILDTRKTIPGLRRFEKYAVSCGGGANHRLDLSSGILVKDNHLAVTGGIPEVVDRLRQSCPGQAVEVEAETRSQIEAGLEAGVDAFLLDNMSVDEVRACVALIRDHPGGESVFIEASGGINPDNIEDYAQTGVDGLSIGYITHSAPFVDMRLELTF